MAQRLFRSDDTSFWGDQMGNGADGVETVSLDETRTVPNATATGTISTNSVTAGDTSFSNGDLVAIIQAFGTGAGNMEYNKVLSGGGSTSLTMAYSLIHTYSTGAQIIKIPQNTYYTLDAGVTLTIPQFDGSIGGIAIIMANQKITINGAIDGKSKGFTGGTRSPLGSIGVQGFGTLGAGTNLTTQNDNGGGGGESGGGFAGSNPGGGGAGGGNATVGADGNNSSPIANGRGYGGDGGAISGNAELTIFEFAGAGAGSGAGFSQCGGNLWSTGRDGTNAGANLILIAPEIEINPTTGSIDLGSDDSENVTGNQGSAGTGAGGNCLMKCVNASLGTNRITGQAGTPGTIGTLCSSSGGRGGRGGEPRFHVDYSGTVSGTTSPTLNTRFDYAVKTGNSASFLYNML